MQPGPDINCAEYERANGCHAELNEISPDQHRRSPELIAVSAIRHRRANIRHIRLATPTRRRQPQALFFEGSTMHALASQTAPERYLDLDWIRIGAFLILIFYHIGMFYVPWDWHVKSPRTLDWLQPVMALTNPWRLTILFIVSGAATRFMADKATVGRFARSRAMRLLPPLAVGMLVIVPPQTWLQVAQEQGTPPMAYLEFWRLYLFGHGHWSSHGRELLTPTWNHLWFVVYLSVYSAGLLAVLATVPQCLTWLQTQGERLLSSRRLLWVPAIYFTFIRQVVAPHFPETHALLGDWTVHADSLAAFLFGYIFAKSDKLWSGFRRWRWTMVAIATGCYAVYAGALIGWMTGLLNPDVAPIVMGWVYGLDQWAWTAAIFGFARKHFSTTDNRLRKYLTKAIFPAYLIHQTIIVMAGYVLGAWALPLFVEALFLMVLTVLGCLIFFEIACRAGPFRLWMGLGPIGGDRMGQRSRQGVLPLPN